MAFAAAIALIGTAITATGAVQQRSATREAARASQRAEEIRRKQLELENVRNQRAIIRQAQQARAQAIAAASSRGAISSDVLQGAFGQVATQSGAQLLAQSENTALSRQMFDANAEFSTARATAQNAAGLMDFGKTLFGNAERIASVGTSLGSALRGPTTIHQTFGNSEPWELI